MTEIREIPMEHVILDPNQPRKDFNETKLQELAESIEQHGLLQPVLLRPVGEDKFQLVHGERRFRACKLLNLSTIRAEIRDLSADEVLEIQLVENLQREDLNPIEEAQTFERMISRYAYTHERIGEKIGKSREYVSKRLRLLKLPFIAQEKIREGELTSSHAEIILSIEDQEEQKEITTTTIEKRLTVRQTKDLADSILEKNVLRRTIDAPENGLVIGIWVSEETVQNLHKMADLKGTTVESLCGRIIEEAVSSCL